MIVCFTDSGPSSFGVLKVLCSDDAAVGSKRGEANVDKRKLVSVRAVNTGSNLFFLSFVYIGRSPRTHLRNSQWYRGSV